MTRGLLFVPALVASLVLAGSATAGPIPMIPDQPGMSSGYLGFCKQQRTPVKEWSCYLNNLLRVVLATKDPANELPQLDTLARRSGGFLAANCHMIMHVVGRTYAVRHHVTLANLRNYLPLSNDPGCSAGFGMGLVMALGPQIIEKGPKGAVAMCNSAPTRFRQYTCYHSLGHAYMRYYDGFLSYGLKACRALGTEALDCAQGVFHDYWLGLSGEDNARSTRGEPRSPRVLCGRQHGAFVIACWFRYYLSLPPKQTPTTPARIEGLCRGLEGMQREGCIASASLLSNPDPVVQFTICSHLPAGDVYGCLRAVGVQNLPDAVENLPDAHPAELRLISRCSTLTAANRAPCYIWFGTTMNVLSNGRFAKNGCPRLATPAARSECSAGAALMGQPLVTFA